MLEQSQNNQNEIDRLAEEFINQYFKRLDELGKSAINRALEKQKK